MKLVDLQEFFVDVFSILVHFHIFGDLHLHVFVDFFDLGILDV